MIASRRPSCSPYSLIFRIFPVFPPMNLPYGPAVSQYLRYRIVVFDVIQSRLQALIRVVRSYISGGVRLSFQFHYRISPTNQWPYQATGLHMVLLPLQQTQCPNQNISTTCTRTYPRTSPALVSLRLTSFTYSKKHRDHVLLALPIRIFTTRKICLRCSNSTGKIPKAYRADRFENLCPRAQWALFWP